VFFLFFRNQQRGDYAVTRLPLSRMGISTTYGTVAHRPYIRVFTVLDCYSIFKIYLPGSRDVEGVMIPCLSMLT